MKKKKDRKGHVDADILQGKADVLRARDAAKKPSQNGAKAKSDTKSEADTKVEKVDVKPVRAVKAKEDEANPTGGKKVEAEAKAGASEKSTVEIPRFNLAKQILAEQRQAASKRRQKSHHTGAKIASYPAADTIGEVIRQAKHNSVEVTAEAGTKTSTTPVHGIVLDDDSMSDSQRRLVADIVSRDIVALCG